MIEIENNRNLKNLKQIGTPREENKIYIENMAYNKIKEESYREKSVFVLMGHTERMDGRYATFIEAVIPVREIEFSGLVPRWNNGTWGEVFREIKRLYEDMIIVGWAMDIKGRSPKMSPDLERVHREHFGGVHQLLFLVDSLEQEETFYMYKENKLISKDGFYIYHKARSKERHSHSMTQEIIPVTVLSDTGRGFRKIESDVNVKVDVSETPLSRGGRYRQLMQEEKKPQKDNGNLGIAIAIAVLVFVVGVGVYENSGDIFRKSPSVETNVSLSTETLAGEEEETVTEQENATIPIEIVPGAE